MKLRIFMPAVMALMIAACGGTETTGNTPANLAESESELVIGQQCGSTTCGKGTYCCNPSCGICVPPGWSCTQQVCPGADLLEAKAPEAEAPVEEVVERPEIIIGGEACGPTVCGKGTTCCNPSCGICTPPGWSCTQQVCDY